VREKIVSNISQGGPSGAPPAGAAGAVPAGLDRVISDAVVDASRPAVAFAGTVVTMGALLSLLVPNIPPDDERDWSGGGASVDGHGDRALPEAAGEVLEGH
jgi:hypothetical protein